MRQLLKQTVSVLRPTTSQGNNFGVVSTNAAVFTGVAASVQPATTATEDFYAQRQLSVTFTVFVASPLALQRGDIVSDGTNSYQVIGWRNLAGRGQVTAIDCVEYLP